MSVKERIREFVFFKGLSMRRFESMCGFSNGYVNNIKSSIQPDKMESISLLFPELNIGWLMTGKGEMLASSVIDRNAVAKDSNNPSPTKAPLIGQYAYAGYLNGFADHEYLEAQPIYVASKRYSGGNYVAFEIRGDSMDDNTRRAICHGDVVLAKELKKDYWKSKLHIPKVFVIVHREEGITCKEVIDHNVETGDIVCHSWNSTHRDFTLNLRDVVQLFYLKEIKRDVM